MSMLTEAEEHLRVIRSLMERATIYRAISAPAALIAGLLACAAGFLLTGRWFTRTPLDQEFQLKWILVLIIASAVNFWFLAREARRRGDPFLSPSMRLALRAMLPPLLCGGVFAWVFPGNAVVPFWLISYGLALLATAHFAPPSLARLGWPFLIAGFVVLLFSVHRLGTLAPLEPWDDYTMAATFGLFHVIYAACAWPRKAGAGEAAPAA